jgi:hypothetical protein
MINGKQIADNSIPSIKIIGGTGGAKRVNFNFATPSPVNLGPIAPGTVVNLAQIAIQIGFDDPTATVTFGIVSDPNLFLGPADTRPQQVTQYVSLEALGPTAPDHLILTISPGASTQGSGFLLYNEGA